MENFFPSEITNPVTVFCRYTNQAANLNTNITCHLEGCVWNQNSISVANRTGVIGGFNSTIRIPYLSRYTGRKYISPARWNSMPYEEVKDEYWTFFAPPSVQQRTIIANGKLDYEFGWHPITGANVISIPENALINTNPANILIGQQINAILFGAYPDLTEDEIREQFPETYEQMGEFWSILIRA